MSEQNDSVEITIHISRETYDRIAFMLGSGNDAKERKESCTRFAELAFRHFYSWLSGSQRYRTLTEQYIDWVESIYNELLPPKEKPTVEKLYNKFNIPHGQAIYICRVLNDKALTHWRSLALEELKNALEEKHAKAEEMVNKGDIEKPLILKLSSLASLELRNITNAMFQDDRSILLPKIDQPYGDIRSVAIPAQTLVRVLKRMAAS